MIAGNLPEGTTVAYTGNSRTDAGTQEVTATITGNNYNDLVLTADLTITKATTTGITLEDGSFVYDGAAKALALAGNQIGRAACRERGCVDLGGRRIIKKKKDSKGKHEKDKAEKTKDKK